MPSPLRRSWPLRQASQNGGVLGQRLTVIEAYNGHPSLRVELKVGLGALLASLLEEIYAPARPIHPAGAVCKPPCATHIRLKLIQDRVELNYVFSSAILHMIHPSVHIP